MKSFQAGKGAFTLLEIMLVVTIIALLITAGIFATRGQLGFAQDTRVDADIQTISTQLKLYQAMNGFLPTTEQGLQALVVRPETEPRPRQWRQLLANVPRDPWQNEYVYVQPGKYNPDSFDLYSLGSNSRAGVPYRGNWQQEQK
jgi:general secretion pathway protein G